MADGVAERLLDDPVGRQLHPGGQRSRGVPVTSTATVRPAASAVGDQLVQPVQGGLGRVVLGGLVGPQHPDHPPQLPQPLGGRGPDGGEAPGQLLGGLRDPVGRGLGLDGDDRHVVGDHVVQLARDPGALLQQGPPGPLGVAASCCSASRRRDSRRAASAPVASRTTADREVISARSAEASSPGMRWTRIAPASRVSSHSSTRTRGRAWSPTMARTARCASRLGSAQTGPALPPAPPR